MLTLTVPNVSAEGPDPFEWSIAAARARDMCVRGLHRLRQEGRRERRRKGGRWDWLNRGMWVLEVTGDESRGYHAHLHLVVSGWVPLQWLHRVWARITGASPGAGAQLSPPRRDPAGYLTKYLSKAAPTMGHYMEMAWDSVAYGRRDWGRWGAWNLLIDVGGGCPLPAGNGRRCGCRVEYLGSTVGPNPLPYRMDAG